MTNSAHFAHLICERQQRGRSRKQFAAEIDPKPETHHRDPEIIDRAGELPDLILGQKLGLIHKDTGDRSGREPQGQHVKKIIIAVKRIGRLVYPDAGGNPPGTGSIVHSGITPRQYYDLLDGLAEAPLGGLDIVEVSPPLDPSERTEFLAAEMLFRVLRRFRTRPVAAA